MDCPAVREVLPEHVLGTLGEPVRTEVERHLAWCAGCRKEAEELAEGLAGLAMALPPAEPPPELEERVVASLSGRGRRPRRASVALIVAAAVAIGSLGLAGAMAARLRSLQDQAETARSRADRTAEQFESLVQELDGRGTVWVAELGSRGGRGGGQALVYDSPRVGDFALVIVGGLPEGGGPYQASLTTSGGPMSIAILTPGAGGQLAGYRAFDTDVPGGGTVMVEDRSGRVLLEGITRPV
jgi:hypothetical protein